MYLVEKSRSDPLTGPGRPAPLIGPRAMPRTTGRKATPLAAGVLLQIFRPPRVGSFRVKLFIAVASCLSVADKNQHQGSQNFYRGASGTVNRSRTSHQPPYKHPPACNWASSAASFRGLGSGKTALNLPSDIPCKTFAPGKPAAAPSLTLLFLHARPSAGHRNRAVGQ